MSSTQSTEDDGRAGPPAWPTQRKEIADPSAHLMEPIWFMYELTLSRIIPSLTIRSKLKCEEEVRSVASAPAILGCMYSQDRVSNIRLYPFVMIDHTQTSHAAPFNLKY